MLSLRAYCTGAARPWVGVIAVVALGLQNGTPTIAQCGPLDLVSGYFEEPVGGEITGSTGWNAAQELVEICSVSSGYGGTRDSLLGLAQDASKEFELSVEVVSIDGHGQAGLEARVFRGTGSDPQQAVVRISVQEDFIAGFAVASGVRSERSAALDSTGSAPVSVQLPVRIGIEGNGSQITTFYFQGQARVDHLTVPVAADSALDAAMYRVALVHGADTMTLPPGMGTGRFRKPKLKRDQSVNPPQVYHLSDNFQGTVDQPTRLTLRGTGLADTQEVMVAGMPATVLEQTDRRLTVEVPATGTPMRGGIVVHTPGGTSELSNAFFSFGKSFIRCDCNGSGEVDLSDMIAMLNHLFLGKPPCVCDESGDCNDDDQRDLSDPVSGLNFFFLGHTEPPHPYPDPGTDPSAPLCGLENQLPTITGISQTQIQEGDEFSILGSGFSETTHVVIPGTRVEVVSREHDRITVKAGLVAHGGTVFAGLIEDFDQVPSLCRPSSCSSTSLGPLCKLDEPLELVPSLVPKLAESSQADEHAPIVIQIDPQSFDSSQQLEVIASFEAPTIANLSPGGRATSFSMSPRETLEETVGALADRLRLEFSGGAGLREMCILPETDPLRIVLVPMECEPTEQILPAGFEMAADVSVLLSTEGRCGSTLTHPINDEREHGWCRLEELVRPCNGLPQFEWYIPLEFVLSKSSYLAGVPNPWDRSPSQKAIMYNWDAYCHVRRHRLWNRCVLERLVERGRTDIPDFPVGAWVTKTIWRSDDDIPAAIDKTKLYSYVYTGDGKTYYLTAIHHTTKDIDKWYWYDLYPAQEVLDGEKFDYDRGIGGCGGTNVDRPDWTTGTIWENYFLCTNVTLVQPLSTSGVGGVGPTASQNSAWCGNFEFATECPDSIDAANLVGGDDCWSGDDTCLNCHFQGATLNVGGGTIGLDFLHSLKSAKPDPDPCYPCAIVPPPPPDPPGGCELPDAPVHFYPYIMNILLAKEPANCHCHDYWTDGTAYEDWVNKESGQLPTMDWIEPGSPSTSYVWHKLKNTYESVGGPTSGKVPMPKYAYPLTDSELNMFEEWIKDGALE